MTFERGYPTPPRPRDDPYGSPDDVNYFDNALNSALDQFAEQVEGLKGDEKAAYENLEFYADYVIGYGNPDYARPSRFLKRIYNRLQYSEDTDFVVLGPRESAKSQAVSVTYTTWKIGRNPLVRFLMCFASKEVQGYPFSTQLANIIEFNERYKDIFGVLRKPGSKNKWSTDERTVDRIEPPGGLKDATISIVALGSAVPSKRADELVVDDIVTPENAYSKILQDKIESFLFTGLFPILTPRGRRIIIGTRWDLKDLYGRLEERWNLHFPPPDPTVNLDLLHREAVEEERARLEATEVLVTA